MRPYADKYGAPFGFRQRTIHLYPRDEILVYAAPLRPRRGGKARFIIISPAARYDATRTKLLRAHAAAPLEGRVRARLRRAGSEITRRSIARAAMKHISQLKKLIM